MTAIAVQCRALNAAIDRVEHLPRPGDTPLFLVTDRYDDYVDIPYSDYSDYSDSPYVDCPYDDYQDYEDAPDP